MAFCEDLGAGPVALVAWSYAGHVALQAASQRPDLFNHIFIYEPGVPSYTTDSDELAAFGRDAEVMFGPIFHAAGKGDTREAVHLLIDGSGGEGIFKRQTAECHQIELENAHTMPLLLPQSAPPHLSCHDLGNLQVLVSIVWGEATRPIFKITSRSAARCLSKSRHIEVPGVGHLWPDQDPKGFAELVRQWLDS